MAVSTKTLHILPNNIQIAFKAGDNLLEILNANNVSISQSCGANGTCTTCLVNVLSPPSHCGPRTELEIERAEERNFAQSERLSCQTTLLESLTIEIKD